uniref:Uncharacterized protein n=1 Tax=Fagus sylvatica TaxID=28930 RepID=A0A2N9H6G2_FAGSY
MSDFDVLGTVGKLALPTFARFWICGKPSLDGEIWSPRTEVATGVFLVRLRAFFRSRIPARPGKVLATIRESSTLCMNVSFFPTCPGLADQLVASQEDSVRKHGNVGGKSSGIFSTVLISSACFHVHVVDVAPDIGFRRSWYRRKACATYFLKVQALHRGDLGSQDMILRTGGRWNVPYAKGSFSD